MVFCFVSDSYPLTQPFGGIAVYTQTAARALNARGHEVHVVVGGPGETCDKMDGSIHVHYRTVRWLPMVGEILPGFGESFWLAKMIRELHRRYHFDLVEFPNFEGLGLVFQALTRVPVVARLHTSMVEIIETQHRPATTGERFMMWAERQSARWARGVVTHSRSHRDRLAALYGLPDIHLIEHGIPLPKLRAQEPSGLSVLSIGHLTARKGGATLLAAIARVCERLPEVSFTLVGATDEEKAVRRFREEHPAISPARVVCRGFVSKEELDALFAAAAVYVSASIYESFGLTFVEAMGRGIPVVGCAISAMNEIIAHERTGLLVPPGEVEPLADAIVRLLGDTPLRSRMGQEGRRLVLERYTDERMGAEIEAWYQKVLRPQESPASGFAEPPEFSPTVPKDTSPLKKGGYRMASAVVRPVFGGIGAILVLHRVIPAEQRSPFPQNRALEITPEDLRGMLGWVRRRGLEPISLDALPERLAAPRKPKFICVTLDDGCADSFHHALPVFRECGVPFAVNVTNGFVGGTVSVWWYLLEEALLANQHLRFRWAGREHEFQTDTPVLRLRAYDELARMLRGLGTRRDELIARIADAAAVDPLACTRRTSMTWDEVRQLAADPLATIGAHTMAHHSLNQLTDAEIEVEVHDARRALEAEIGRKVRHFAYPFGGRNAVTEREFALLRRGGFDTMLTTRNANLFPKHAKFADRLPRLGISGNYPAVETLGIIESGLLSMLEWRFKRVVGE